MTITHEEISQRAYEIWERDGRPVGRDSVNWFRAEEELREESRKKTPRRTKKSTDPAFLKTPKGERI